MLKETPMPLSVPIPVYFLLRENTLAIDLVGPAEVFRYANRIAQDEGKSPIFVTHYITGANQVTTSIGLGLTGVLALPEKLQRGAMLVLIGCLGKDDDFSDSSAQATVTWLRGVGAWAHRLLCICTGAILAGHAGLLNGRRCTTHHGHYDDLRRVAPQAHVLENRIFVEDGTVCTSAGVTAGIDLALHVVAEAAGNKLAMAVARKMVIYMRRTGADPQLSPRLAYRNHLHQAVHRVQDAIIDNPTHDWRTDQLAKIACTSERHLTRVFREQTGSSVTDFIHHVRIALARDLLTQSQLSVERIAERAGFGSARQLRRIWKKFEATTPSRFRTIESFHQARSIERPR